MEGFFIVNFLCISFCFPKIDYAVYSSLLFG